MCALNYHTLSVDAMYVYIPKGQDETVSYPDYHVELKLILAELERAALYVMTLKYLHISSIRMHERRV